MYRENEKKKKKKKKPLSLEREGEHTQKNAWGVKEWHTRGVPRMPYEMRRIYRLSEMFYVPFRKMLTVV